MLSVIAAIRDVALQNPNHPAYQTNNASITYGELWDYSDCLAHHIMALALKKTTAYYCLRAYVPFTACCFLGTVKSGHPYVPVDSSTPVERLQVIIEASEACLLLTTEELTTSLSIPVVAVSDCVTQNKHDNSAYHLGKRSGNSLHHLHIRLYRKAKRCPNYSR